MKSLSEIFQSFSSRIAALKLQGKPAEARALILQRADEVAKLNTISIAPTVAAQGPTQKPSLSMDHTSTIAALSSRLTALEGQLSSLKGENAILKSSLANAAQSHSRPVVLATLETPLAEREKRLSELALEFSQKVRTKDGETAFLNLHGDELHALCTTRDTTAANPKATRYLYDWAARFRYKG